jgi:large subunit ribosomal protein L17
LLGDKEAVKILFDEIAPRMADRDGGYTRILKLAKPRLGDAGVQAILEFVGRNDRVKVKSQKPSFEDDVEETTEEPAKEEAAETEESTENADTEGGETEAKAEEGEES